ncbi:MAG: hypothetical protein AAGF95_01195 [Chloroflexota bacterium]
MVTRFSRSILLIIGIALLGLIATPAAAAPVAPPTPDAVRCIPWTNICSGATVQNNTSVQFGVRGEDINTRQWVDRVLVQGQNSFDIGILDADFIYSSTYRIVDVNSNGFIYNPGQYVKVSDLQNAVAVDGNANGEFVILLYR